MTYTDELISHFYLATLFIDFDGPDRVARALSEADVGLETVGDLRKLSLPELRRTMTELSIRKNDQDVFLNQLRASHVFPRGVSSAEEFGLH